MVLEGGSIHVDGEGTLCFLVAVWIIQGHYIFVIEMHIFSTKFEVWRLIHRSLHLATCDFIAN